MQNRPVAVVTGASSGFGMLTSVALARAGYTVISTMRDPARRVPLDKLAEAGSVTEHIEVLPLDVTSAEQISEAISTIIATHHQIDLLVNNAGYASGGFVEEISAEQWRRQFDVNVFGVIDVTRAVLPHMRERKSGTIINLSSISGRFGFPGLAPYAASKHAIEGFSEALRLEMLPYDVRVVLIEPGSYRTSIWEKGMQETTLNSLSPYAAQTKQMISLVQSIMQQAADPAEVVSLIVRVAKTPNPRLRYPVGRGVGFTILAKSLLPWKWIESFVRRAKRTR
ncbi:short-chain dehydrogenase/reductase [Brevibacillus reuszeri]|uniref:Short-chain dehydrogenase n=1 Tax=Brevibacillus reuszeri TaxID=54915 RepID=A0A0K9YMD1_9BACL|nr:SDR family oxidoreductase [Brevibacillus reuszeri]KNB69854.1 short-chain dehydrogenase [Brevibacillus reuszeri]MED1858208.1 SDR family oxidoreductase [Brevibacillus reuszeri]GED68798.1 short-chain dehydrogenase/reductase [Brevibacillus reuszeri]